MILIIIPIIIVIVIIIIIIIIIIMTLNKYVPKKTKKSLWLAKAYKTLRSASKTHLKAAVPLGVTILKTRGYSVSDRCCCCCCSCSSSCCCC